MLDPWQLVDALDGWTVLYRPTPGLGRCVWVERTIYLHTTLTPGQLRAVLTHELVHALRGPSPRFALAWEEDQVRRISARLLIDLGDLLEAAAWSQHLAVVADELWVDAMAVEVRVTHLDRAEREALEARVADLFLP